LKTVEFFWTCNFPANHAKITNPWFSQPLVGVTVSHLYKYLNLELFRRSHKDFWEERCTLHTNVFYLYLLIICTVLVISHAKSIYNSNKRVYHILSQIDSRKCYFFYTLESFPGLLWSFLKYFNSFQKILKIWIN